MVFFTANGEVLFFSKEAKSDRKKKYKTSDRRNTAGVSRRGAVGVTTKEPFLSLSSFEVRFRVTSSKDLKAGVAPTPLLKLKKTNLF
ncbi:MAG: hypothetical protein IJ870_06495 [Alphaproteobacteria bacterium]|nr:hypothetical protein [Alphaproteobacteria bacterium]